MNKSQNILIGILKSVIVIFLSVHLFGIHAKLLYFINPDKMLLDGIQRQFSFLHMDENNLVSLAFAGAYSIATVFIIVIFDRKNKLNSVFMILFSALDGLGIFIYYNTKIMELSLVGSIYYACYTVVIFLAIGFLNFISIEVAPEAIKEPEISIEEKVVQMLKDGIKQTEIASKLGVSQPYVSKINKKINN